MRAIIYFLFIWLFVGCNFGKVPNNKINSSDIHRKDLILNSLQQTNPIARRTILEVIDTVEYYKSRLSAWPDSAVYTILDRYRERVFGELNLKNQSCFSNIVYNDTTMFNSFSRILETSDYDYSDKIVLADFELISYQFLNKKYNRILKNETIEDHLWNKLSSLHILGENYTNSIEKVIGEFLFNPNLMDFDEYDLTLYKTHLAKVRFYQLTSFFSILTDHTNVKPCQSEGNNVDSVFELATSINGLLKTEQQKVVISENINSFYTLYRELYHLSLNMVSTQRMKYDIFLEHFCDLEYKFLSQVKENISESNSYKQ